MNYEMCRDLRLFKYCKVCQMEMMTAIFSVIWDFYEISEMTGHNRDFWFTHNPVYCSNLTSNRHWWPKER